MRGGVIYVHWCRTHEVSGELEKALIPCLGEDEKARYRRFRFAADQRTFLVTHVLARCLLAAATGRALESWTFRYGSHGKPEPVTLFGEPDIRMNVSHCSGLAMIGLTVSCDVGVDVEPLDRPHALEVANNFFAEEEIQHIQLADEAIRRHVAVGIWTLKEAFVKATGTGLSAPLDSFAVGLSPPRLLRGTIAQVENRYRFFRIPIADEFLAAVVLDVGKWQGEPTLKVIEVTDIQLANLASCPVGLGDFGVF